jgi:hypothetical protein
MNEAEEIKQLLEAEGYQTCDIFGPFEELVPIAEAVKDAPMHWP